MPKAMKYKANSVIYFKGDVSDRIFILNNGRISLNSSDIETGQEIQDHIQTGEFFGVKSALGKYPREENAVVLSDAAVIMFSVPEFEQLVLQKTRIIMKMLKVFSNQLRRIHKRVRSLLAMEEQVDAETGLFRIGEYYLKKKQYAGAVYVFNRYLTYYPSGKYNQKAMEYLNTAENYSQKYGHGKGPGVPGLQSNQEMNKPQKGKELSDTAKTYYNAISIFSQQKYSEALKEFKKIAESSNDQEYVVKSLFEIGRCLFSMSQFDEAIKHFTSLIQKYPKMPDLSDALFYVGQSYQEKGDSERSRSFYNKILSMPSNNVGLQRKVKKALKSMEES